MSLRPSRQLLWIAAAAAVMVAVDLGRRIFVNNDEARFAVLAQDMLARGHWLLPQLDGGVYYNKPVLLAWLIALCSWPVGQVTQLTAVLPSAAAGVATALVVYALGRQLFGGDAGRYAALVSVTTYGLFFHARVALPDMLMTTFVAASVWMLWPMTRSRPGLHWLGFYGLASLAFWAKGPAGLLPLAVAGVWAIAAGAPGAWRRLRLLPGALVVAALVAPWWWLTLASDVTAASRAVATDQLAWYLPQTPTLSTLVNPLQNVVEILFPWVLVVPVAVTQAARFLRGRGVERDGVLFLVVWAAVTLGFVTLSHQQRLRYYLPLVPSASLLIGWWCAGAIVRRREARAIPWRAYALVAGGLVVVKIAVVRAVGRAPKDPPLWWPTSALETLVLAGALAVTAVALLHGVLRSRRATMFTVAWFGVAVLLSVAYHATLTRQNAAFDYPRVWARVKPLVRDAPVVAAWELPALPLSFYSRQTVLAVESDGELRLAVGDRTGLVILTETALARVGERDRLAVLMHDRLAFRSVAVVSYAPEPRRPAATGGARQPTEETR